MVNTYMLIALRCIHTVLGTVPTVRYCVVAGLEQDGDVALDPEKLWLTAMYTYVYIYIYTYTYVYVTFTYIYRCLHICLYTFIYIYIYTYLQDIYVLHEYIYIYTYIVVYMVNIHVVNS